MVHRQVHTLFLDVILPNPVLDELTAPIYIQGRITNNTQNNTLWTDYSSSPGNLHSQKHAPESEGKPRSTFRAHEKQGLSCSACLLDAMLVVKIWSKLSFSLQNHYNYVAK